MADNYLITGYWGEPHVTAENDRGINAAIFGKGRKVLPVGEQFRAEYIGNNTIRVYDGKLVDNGAAAGIPAGQFIDLYVSETGQGKYRNDLIIFKYVQDTSTLIETGTFEVLKGAESSGTPTDPTLTQNDLLSGSAVYDEMALWRVSVAGATISAPVQLFDVVNLSAVGEHTHSADDIDSGTLPLTRGGTGGTSASTARSKLGAVAKAGDTMTGKLIAQNNTDYSTKQMRNIFIVAEGDTLPSGSNGDICLVYTP